MSWCVASTARSRRSWRSAEWGGLVQYVGLEDRDPETPPVDVLAEAIVLLGIVEQPQRLDAVDLAPLLVTPEHRLILQAIHAARIATVGQRWSDFYLRWFAECEQRLHGLADVIDYRLVDKSWQRWMRTRHDRADLRPYDPSGHISNYAWWLDRLRRVAAARYIIDRSQRAAERAWRGDVDGAVQAIGSIRQQRAEIRVDV